MNTNEMHTPEDLFFSLCLDNLQKAHDIYRQHCFENDFVNRCAERYQNEIGMRNLPYKTLSEEKELLSNAYQIFCNEEDCNVSYNDTLDHVIDKIEEQIVNNIFSQNKRSSTAKVVIVIEESMVLATYSTDPSIYIEIVNLDYASSEEQNNVFDAYEQNTSFHSSNYSLELLGYEESTEQEDL